MENTEMSNKCPRDNDPTKQQNTKHHVCRERPVVFNTVLTPTANQYKLYNQTFSSNKAIIPGGGGFQPRKNQGSLRFSNSIQYFGNELHQML